MELGAFPLSPRWLVLSLLSGCFEVLTADQGPGVNHYSNIALLTGVTPSC